MLKQLSPSGSSVNSAKYLARRFGSRYIIIHHYSPLLRGIVVYYLLKVLINVGKLNDLPGGKGWGGGVGTRPVASGYRWSADPDPV